MTTLAAALALFAPPAAALTSGGCFPPLICTEVGYENGLRLDVEVPATPATYRIQVEASGETLELQYKVDDQGIQCVECTASGERLSLSESFVAHAEDLVVNIARADHDGGPRTATVRVFRGDVLAAEETFEPRYEVDEPNGRGCGEHVHASATLAVP